MNLTPRQHLIIDGALRIAQVQYATDAANSKDYPRLEAAFLQQAKECGELLAELENQE